MTNLFDKDVLIPSAGEYRLGVAFEYESNMPRRPDALLDQPPEIRVIRYDVMGTILPAHRHVFHDLPIHAIETAAEYINDGVGAMRGMWGRFVELFEYALAAEYADLMDKYRRGDEALAEVKRLIKNGYTSADCPWNLDPEKHEEYYRFLVYTFDVRRAKQILAERPHEIRLLSIRSIKPQLCRPEQERWEDVPDRPGVRRLVGWFNPLAPSIDWDIIDSGKVDLTIPVIMACILDPNTGAILQEWVIDGWHRMAHAAECGLDVVPFVRLTATESGAVCRRG
jgi:hypothetical protein